MAVVAAQHNSTPSAGVVASLEPSFEPSSGPTTSDDMFDALSDFSVRASPPHRRLKLQAGQPTKTLQDKRRRAQMRLVNVKRGSVKPRSGEPKCLDMFIADVQLALGRQRGEDGRCMSTPPHA